MTIGTQRLTVDPRQRDGVENFIPVQAKHLGDHRRGGHFDQQDVIETDAVKRVFQRDAALNFMSFNHSGEHFFHG